MYKRMLIPLDGSPLAEKVLPYTKQIADKLNLQLIFLHVCEDGDSSRFVCEAYIEHVAELAKTRSIARGEVVSGNAAKAIINYASNHNIDLILLATHGQSGFGRWTTGSTAHKVITLSRKPILLVRPNISKSLMSNEWPKTILAPLDGSPLAESVLPHLQILALQGQMHPEVILLKVCEPPDLLGDYPEASMSLTWEDHVKRATIASQQTCSMYLADAHKRLEAVGVKTHSEVILGDKDNVAQEITGYVSRTSCDLIAMSTHGRSGMSEWPYGHVTDRLVRTTSVPLFLVRPNKTIGAS